MKQVVRALTNLGLDEQEALVYHQLLEEGEQSASRIAGATGLTRPTTYRVLMRLSVKGLTEEIKRSSKKWYRAHNPKQFSQLLKESSRDLEHKKATLEKIEPKLAELFAAFSTESRATFYEGSMAAVNVFRDQLTEGNYEKLVLASIVGTVESLTPKFLDEYERAKPGANIKTRVIMPDTQEDKELLTTAYKHVEKKYHPQVKLLKPELFKYGADINIYGKDKLSAINFRDNNSIAVVIQDQTLHNTLTMMFELIWDSLPVTEYSTWRES